MDLWVVSNTLTPFSKHQLEKYVKHSSLDIYQTKQLRLMIDVKNTYEHNETTGMIDLFDLDPYHQRAGVGIMIHQKFRNRGIADAALKTFVHYCFENLGLHQLYCSISANNTISQKLFENNGFNLIGIKRDWLKTSEGYLDELFYQLIH